MPDTAPIRRALLSVSDKAGLIDFAKALAAAGVELISTGGTAAALAKAGLDVLPIDRVTAFPEIMDGRVKTLHPAVHGALLAVRDNPEHVDAMTRHGIRPIDLVCVNLYPFEATVAKPNVTRDHAIENIDIGGPSMIRSAAKNHAFVTVVTDPAQYPEVIAELAAHGGTSQALRERLAHAAFQRTARYDAAISTYLASPNTTDATPASPTNALPASLALNLARKQELRYGENPHQPAALYSASTSPVPGSLLHARQLHGKELSYNNINDAAAALELTRQLKCVTSASGPVGAAVWSSLANPAPKAPTTSWVAAAVVKHMNPCGAALATNPLYAVNLAIAGDPIAAYGGILALSAPLDDAAAQRLCDKDIFMEVLVAPAFAPDALERLKARWTNLRILETGELSPPPAAELELRSVPGPGQAFLAQHRDTRLTRAEEYQHRAGPKPTPALLAQAAALEAVCRALTSNAVCIGGPDPAIPGIRLFGAGAGQMDRVTSCRLATEKAGPLTKGALAFSDAFFPFSDGPQILINAGVTAIIHPGGSKRDDDTFALCERHSVTCLTTGMRHFRH